MGDGSKNGAIRDNRIFSDGARDKKYLGGNRICLS